MSIMMMAASAGARRSSAIISAIWLRFSNPVRLSVVASRRRWSAVLRRSASMVPRLRDEDDEGDPDPDPGEDEHGLADHPGVVIGAAEGSEEAADDQDAECRDRQTLADETLMHLLAGRFPEEAELDGRDHDRQYGRGAAERSTDRTTEKAKASRAHTPSSP